MQRLVRGTLASMILIVPTYLGVKFISEPSSERMVANLTPEERRVFEERAVVTSQNLQVRSLSHHLYRTIRSISQMVLRYHI